jgi:hypothetical protein
MFDTREGWKTAVVGFQADCRGPDRGEDKDAAGIENHKDWQSTSRSRR